MSIHSARTPVRSDIASPSPLAFISFSMATGIQALIYTGKLDAAGQEFMLLIGCADLGSWEAQCTWLC